MATSALVRSVLGAGRRYISIEAIHSKQFYSFLVKITKKKPNAITLFQSLANGFLMEFLSLFS
ncbi:hypothetical protein [Bacillus sp. 03113]|uniref:hypothetical protein n=1 Tax=Bacillus sp. 03113 TaxID=2578211 RepID=UPI0015E8D726|nr:hypothetical protein [Bacillus sp. 03113]